MEAAELRRLFEGAKATKYVNYEWIAEVCEHLRKLANGRVDDEVRVRVSEAPKKVREELDRRIELWAVRGVDDGELWPIYERLIVLAELLAERPDRLAVVNLCSKAKAIAFTVETARKVASLK